MLTRPQAQHFAVQYSTAFPDRVDAMLSANAWNGTIGGVIGYAGVAAAMVSAVVTHYQQGGWTVVDDGISTLTFS